MSNSALLAIIPLAATTEATQELQNYWQNRYQEMIDQGLFTLNPKTIDLLNTSDQINKPSTPFGELVLNPHLDNQNQLDEFKLQNTVETAVRFLDSLIDKINFGQEARFVVNQYRKIGLGLADFDQYLQKTKARSSEVEANRLGNLISNNGYRTSETLAEEKGLCDNWDTIKKNLKNKSFEYWYDVETGDIKSGAEMTEDFDQQSVQNSNFEIVPRRNSDIFIYPNSPLWQAWSDRDLQQRGFVQTTASTPLQTNGSAILAVQDEVKTRIEEPEIKEILPNIQESILPVEKNQKSEIQPEGIFDQTPAKLEEAEISGNLESENLQAETNPNSDQLQSLDVLPVVSGFEEQNEIKGHENEENQQEMVEYFQIGELVQVQNEGKDEHGKIYQIIDSFLDEQTGQTLYRLTDGKGELEGKAWSEEELTAADLSLILNKVNQNNEVAIVQSESQNSEQVQPFAEAIILNDQDQILIYNQGEKLSLPQAQITKNQIPEETLLKTLQEKYKLLAEIEEEIGSSVTFSENEEPSKLHLGFLVKLNSEQKSEMLTWQPINSLYEAPQYLTEMIDKAKTAQAKKQLTEEMSTLRKQISELKFSELTLQQKNKSLQEQASSAATNHNFVQNSSNNSTFNNNPIENLRNNSNNNSNNFKPFSQNNSTNNMSKYALQLQQLINTKQFSDVLITLQYDGNGPKLISAVGDKLDAELKHLINTVLGIVNMALSKGVTPTEVAEQLELEPTDDGIKDLPLNNLLKVVASALRQAPAKIQDIDSNILMEILPDFVKDFTKTSSPNILPFMNDKSGENAKNEAPSKDEIKEQKVGETAYAQPETNENEANNQANQQPSQQSGRGSFFGGFGARSGNE